MNTEPKPQPPSESKPQRQSEPTEFEKASQELGRAFAVYFAWKSAGLLDKKE